MNQLFYDSGPPISCLPPSLPPPSLVCFYGNFVYLMFTISPYPKQIHIWIFYFKKCFFSSSSVYIVGCQGLVQLGSFLVGPNKVKAGKSFICKLKICYVFRRVVKKIIIQIYQKHKDCCQFGERMSDNDESCHIYIR